MTQLLASLLLVASARAQVALDTGAAVFAKVSDAVVFLIVQDDKGVVIGQGSGFVFETGLIVTNAHVAGAGKVFVKAGTFNIPCTVERLDAARDLAVLRPTAVLATTPLSAANSTPPNGTTVFALGNPKGLERTISQGLLTGSRKMDDQEMLQISAPISPGSSGGPVVLSTGEVIGVVTASLASGQNLNFAVPISAVRALLSADANTIDLFDSLVKQVSDARIVRAKLEYSVEPSSDYQQNRKQEDALLIQALNAAGKSPDRLLRLARLGAAAKADFRVTSARLAFDATKRPNTEVVRLLGAALQQRAYSEEGDQRAATLREAEAIAELSNTPRASFEDIFLLADIQDDQPNREASATTSAQRALTLATTNTERARAYRVIFSSARKQKALKAATEAYQKLVATGEFGDFDTQAFAKFLVELKRHKDAAAVYVALASKQDLFLFEGKHDMWCEAARNALLADDEDGALADARNCVAAAALVKDAEVRVAQGHRIISAILLERDVYESALQHAREASNVEPEGYYAFLLMAKALNGLERYAEAEAAAKRALDLSDGKDVGVHFALGSAYFEQKKWSLAKKSFETAARMDPTDASAAYNVATCLFNDKFYKDAIPWYEETLRRDPTISGYQEIRQKIISLRAR